MPGDLSATFIALLAEFLDEAAARTLAGRLGTRVHAPQLLVLLMELRDCSPKAATVAVETLPRLLDLLPEEELLLWIDLGVSLSEQSGAVALKYCGEAETILETAPPDMRAAALRVALELADQDAALALEGFRTAAAVASIIGIDTLPSWAVIGADLARWDYVIGVEYFRRSPDAIRVLSLDDMKGWASVSVKLVLTNAFGKPDYMPALTYMRSSALLFADVSTLGPRQRLLALVSVLADRSPSSAMALLGEAPGLLRRVATPEWQERVLRYGMLVADKDAEATLAYMRRTPELLGLIGGVDVELSDAMARFEDWFKAGVEVLDLNPEAARAYFATETRKALEALERAAGGVALKDVMRALKLFGEGLSGKPLQIHPHGHDEREASSARSPSGEALIVLPARMRRYPERHDNLRMYKLMTAHEAGHFEYGTYDLDLGCVQDLASQACLRYGRPSATRLRSLADLFECYPQPFLIRDLWQLTEDARIDASLKAEYPGLRRDMEQLLVNELSMRTLTHGMSVKEMIVELLLQLSANGANIIRIPFALEDVVTRAWGLLRAVVHPGISTETVLRAVHRAYVLIEELTAASDPVSANDPGVTSDLPNEPRAGESQGGAYKALDNFAYRGEAQMFELANSRSSLPRAETDGSASSGAAASQAPAQASLQPPPREGQGSLLSRGTRPYPKAPPLSEPLPAGQAPGSGSAAAESSSGEAGQPGFATAQALAGDFDGPEPAQALRTFFYDEWDGRILDYRPSWCRVIEQTAPEGLGDFVERTRTTYGGIVTLIRRYFEGIRPLALRRLRRQSDGEEIDLEAVIESLVERRTETSPTEDVYIRKDRRERDVAVAFLVDLSGSTGRQIEPGGMRIIDIEKEGLVLLAEGLEAIGDQYALYGYSGQSRNEVQFLVMKDFDESYGPAVWRRIDAVRPLVQNRDGAAIRHATHRLLERAARVKLLIILSDGRPLDDLYADEYALEDTKAALHEAKGKGIHPFCVTVDHEESGYLARMYGEVRYIIIDRVQTLPERLPKIYRMLTT